MKKLLVLALVLSIAAMANATIVTLTPSATTVTQNQVVTVTATGDTTAALDYVVMDLGQISAGTLLWTKTVLAGELATVTEIGDLLPNQSDMELGSGSGPGSATPLTAGVQFNGTFKVAASASGSFYMYLEDQNSDIRQTIKYTVVPEPMTIGLLGIGGLFLRRRK